MRAVKCPGCGTSLSVETGKTSRCEFCGTHVDAYTVGQKYGKAEKNVAGSPVDETAVETVTAYGDREGQRVEHGVAGGSAAQPVKGKYAGKDAVQQVRSDYVGNKAGQSVRRCFTGSSWFSPVSDELDELQEKLERINDLKFDLEMAQSDLEDATFEI